MLKNKREHKHDIIDFCTCGALAEEPSDDCYVHGTPYPFRCCICGQFISVKEYIKIRNRPKK